MAHLLRAKQAGVSNDLSQGLGPDLFVLDHVRLTFSTPPLCSRPWPCRRKLTTCADSQLWHKFKSHPSCIRPRTVPHRCRHEREQIWPWSDLHIRPKEGRSRATTSQSQRLGQDSTVLRRKAAMRRFEKRLVSLLASNQEAAQRTFPACKDYGTA